MKFIARHVSRRAFTLVELLIVISVIGIIATISVVSYRGVQERARTAAAIDGANQAADLLESYQLKNSGLYPATGNQSAAGIMDTQSLKYQYSQALSGANYCLTATNNNVSYMISQDAKPTPGACPGHGLNGIAAITNLSTNPRATVAGSGWSSNNPAIYPSTKGIAITGHPTGISTATRSQLASGQSSGCVMSLYNLDTLANSATQRSVGVWVMVNTTGYQAAVVGTGFTASYSPLTPNTWLYIKSPSALTSYAGVNICKISGTAAASDLGYATGVISVAGTTSYNYADGDTTNWIWNGTAYNSTSTGPPQ